MQNKLKLFLFLALPLFSFAQNPFKGKTVYEVFVRSFQDFNGDGKGDFDGLHSRLNYLNDGNPNTYSDLGIGAIWLMPIQPSPSYHGYDVTNYKAVNPDYGNMEQFKDMLATAHKNGIKVIIDLVLNHTSTSHPWFVKSAANDSFYRNFYRWENSVLNNTGPWGQQVWHSMNGKYYYGVFWSGMPDLNYNYQPVRDSIFDMAKFWLKEVGVDGFRLDAVTYLYEEGNTLKHHPNTLSFWRQFKDSCKTWNPNAYLVAEVWDPQETIKLYAPHFDHCFEFGVSGGNLTAIGEANPNNLRNSLSYALANYDFATFLTNHDQDRIASVFGNNQDKLKAAASLLLTQPGTPYLYYGEEVAMLGSKPDENIRRPMQWSNTSYAGFTTGFPWRPLNNNYPQFNVATLRADSNSIFNHYRKLIHFRNQYEAVNSGGYKNIISTQNEVQICHRFVDNQDVYVLINTSPKAFGSVQFTITREDNMEGIYYLKDVMADTLIRVQSGTSFFGLNLSMQPYQTRILIFDNPTGTQTQLGSTRNLQIYPNPAHDKVWIDLNDGHEISKVSILDMSGKVCYEEKVQASSTSINLNLPAGAYLVYIEDELGNTAFKKLLIK